MEAESAAIDPAKTSDQSAETEIELINKLRKGDKEVVKIIFNTNFDKLYSFVFHEVEQNHSAAEDIVQDTFISAIKSASKFKGNSRIYTWLVGIAHHKIADYYRHAKRESKHDDRNSEGHTSELDLAIDNSPQGNIAESTEQKILIDQALNSLPPDYRETIILKYVEDFPVDEIARILNRSPKSIEGILSRARKAMKEIINNQSEG
jgi:RNA polymerase sigma-70 factor, ECF subfamily